MQIFDTIAFFGKRQYDYLDATIVEGLRSLGYRVVGPHGANYVEELLAPSLNLESALVVVSDRTHLRSEKALSRTMSKTPVIFLDGEDVPYICLKGLRASKLYVKRELLRFPLRPSKLIQLGFGVENRYFDEQGIKSWADRSVDITCTVSVSTNSARRSYLNLLETIRFGTNLNIVTKHTGECAYSKLSGAPIPTPNYYRLLANSRVSVSLLGRGQDCARFWETLARGALLLSEQPKIIAQNMPLNGEHCIYFDGLKDFSKKLLWIFNNPASAETIAKNGFNWARENRTTREHVRIYFLGAIEGALEEEKRLGRTIALFWALIYNLYARCYFSYFHAVRKYLL